jgi:rhodanese-related sulfurtransferase
MHRIGILTLLAVLVVAPAGCSRAEGGGLISQGELSDAIAGSEKILLLDVRTPEEFQTSHIPGALNVPHTEAEGWLRTQDLPRDRDVVVYCETGRRSTIVQQMLMETGFTSVRRLDGDMRAWRVCEACAKE